MSLSKVLSQEAMEHLIEDVGLEQLLLMNDIDPYEVLQILIRGGMIDLEYFTMEIENDDE